MKFFPKHIRMPSYVKIIKIIQDSIDVKTFYFKHSEIAHMAKPGQFLMVLVFNHLEEESEEIPISISYINKDIIGISVKKVGKTTNSLHKHIINHDDIGIKGPYGNSFDVMGNNIAIIGGGIGMAPMMPILEKKDINIDIFLGGINSNHLCFLEQIKSKVLKNKNIHLHIATDDGSYGYRGYIVDYFSRLINPKFFDQIITVGPELMMKKVLCICNEFNIPLQASLERYMNCSRGLCGSCVVGDYRVCKDGPVFSKKVLNKIWKNKNISGD